MDSEIGLIKMRMTTKHIDFNLLARMYAIVIAESMTVLVGERISKTLLESKNG